MMPRIRVGVRAWNGAGPAQTYDEIGAARQVMWIEIDGQRLDGSTLRSVSGEWDADSFHTTSVEFLGLPEFVYLDQDGAVLSGR